MLKPKAKFNVYNALATIGTVKMLGMEMDNMQEMIAGLSNVDGRMQEVPNNLGANIIVDYSHTPDSLANALSAVSEFTDGRIITIVGCGGDRDKEKRAIMGKVAGEMSGFAILTSDNPRNENPFDVLSQIESGIKQTGKKYAIIENRKDAIFAGVKMLKAKDSLVIAGKGSEDYQIIGAVKTYFSDYETALEALNEIDNISNN